MPFITEELYQRLPYKPEESICIAKYPESDSFNRFESTECEQQVQSLMHVIHAIRSIKSNLDYKNTKPAAKIYFKTEETRVAFPCDYLECVQALAKCQRVEITNEYESDENAQMIEGVVDANT